MSLEIERIPTLRDNYTYLVICTETREAAIVDAPEFDPVVRCVERTDCRVKKVLSTHHHFDHSAANPKLAQRYGAPVYGHVSDAGRLPGLTHGVEDGDTIEVGLQTARVLYIPSHTMGHVAYVFDHAKALFSGDMLFAAGCGRLFEGNAQMMYHALCEKLTALPDDMRVFCGHEYTESNLLFAITEEPENEDMRHKLERVREIRSRAAADWHDAAPSEMTIPSTIAEERATNPFMRARDSQELGRIRQAKDSF